MRSVLNHSDELKSWHVLESNPHLVSSDGLATPAYSPNHEGSRSDVCDIYRYSATEMDMSGKSIYEHCSVDTFRDLDMSDDGEQNCDSDNVRCSLMSHYNGKKTGL